jgi:hypothetical protein
MSRMAFLTRRLTLSQLPLPSLSTAGFACSADAYFWTRSNASTGTLSLSPPWYPSTMNSRLMPRGRASPGRGSADAVVLVHDQVAHLQVAEVREEPAGAAAAAARLQGDLLREDVAVRQHPQRDLGQLEARGERAHPDLDGGLCVDGEPVLAQHVAQAVRAADCCPSAGRCGRAPRQVAESARRSPA